MNIDKFFKSAKANNKLSHLYLIVCEEGSLREKIVLNAINTLNNKEYIHRADAIEKYNLQWLYSSTGVIKKEEITSLQKEFSKTSFKNETRIFVIDGVEKMNKQSSNAILKFLEDPPQNTIGLLFTENLNTVLNTIKSRCQILYTNKVTKKQIEKGLTDLGYDKKVVTFLSTLTTDIDKAKNYIKNGNIDHLRKFIENFSILMEEKKLSENWFIENTSFVIENKEMFICFTRTLENFFINYLKKNKKINSLVYKILSAVYDINNQVKYNVNIDMLRRKLAHTIFYYIEKMEK